MQHEKDFLVFNSFNDSDLDVLKNFNLIKKNKNIKDVLSRKPTDESDDFYILSLARNLTSNNIKLFRKNDSANAELVKLWLSIVERKSLDIYFSGNVKKFDRIHYKSLINIARISNDVDSIHYITRVLQEEYGVIVVFEKSFKGMKLDGCTFCLPNGTPVIGMSLRYPRYDYFWFTLMHELSHVSLHYNELDTPIIDNLDEEGKTEIEIEANRIAADSLIPRDASRAIYRTFNEPDDLLTVCQRYEIHPIIASGAIRNKFKNYVIFSSLVNSINVRKELGLDE